MNGIEAVGRIDSAMELAGGPTRIQPTTIGQVDRAQMSFAQMLSEGVNDMQSRIDRANSMVLAYAVGEDIPEHQVMIALEEARISVELGLQVRNRLVDAYRDIMAMQL